MQMVGGERRGSIHALGLPLTKKKDLSRTGKHGIAGQVVQVVSYGD